MAAFLRRHWGRIAIGTIALVAVYLALCVCLPYLREQRIVRMIKLRGDVRMAYVGPSWLPQFVQDRTPFLERIDEVFLGGDALPADGFSELGSLWNLKTLDLSFYQVTDADLKHLQRLTRLKSLTLSDTPISDQGLTSLKGMASLQFLDLSNTAVTDAGLEHLKGLSKLNTLWVCDTQITDAGLVHLKGLVGLDSLELSGTQVTDGGLVHLIGMSSLKYMSLETTEVTEDGRAMLQKALPNCSINPAPHP